MDLFSQLDRDVFKENRQVQAIRRGINEKKLTTFDRLRLKMIKDLQS